MAQFSEHTLTDAVIERLAECELKIDFSEGFNAAEANRQAPDVQQHSHLARDAI